MQLTDIFVLEKTTNIPDHIHNSLGRPQSVLVNCWSICICMIVYFLKGCFLNLNVFPLRCVSTDSDSWMIVLTVPSQAGLVMLSLKELCLFFLPSSFPLWAMPSTLTSLQWAWSAPDLQEKAKGAFLTLERLFWILKCLLNDGLAQHSSTYFLLSPWFLFQAA